MYFYFFFSFLFLKTKTKLTVSFRRALEREREIKIKGNKKWEREKKWRKWGRKLNYLEKRKTKDRKTTNCEKKRHLTTHALKQTYPKCLWAFRNGALFFHKYVNSQYMDHLLLTIPSSSWQVYALGLRIVRKHLQFYHPSLLFPFILLMYNMLFLVTKE